MQPTAVCVVLVLLLPRTADAGQIYGSISEAGRAVAKTPVEIACEGIAAVKGSTSSDGSYRLDVPKQGRCTLTLPGYAGRPSSVVFSYSAPSRNDFELVKTKNAYELRRR